MTGQPDPPEGFAAPWQAELFAITTALHQAGHFAWADWGAAFGAALKAEGAQTPIAAGEDYWMIWLDTLEQLLSERNLAASAALSEMKARWSEAYLSTPHGQPVILTDAPAT